MHPLASAVEKRDVDWIDVPHTTSFSVIDTTHPTVKVRCQSSFVVYRPSDTLRSDFQPIVADPANCADNWKAGIYSIDTLIDSFYSIVG